MSNSQAIWQALRGQVSEFVRTPKRGDRAVTSYQAPRANGLVELLCAGWAGVGAYLGVTGARPWMGLLMGVYCMGFGFVGFRLWREGRDVACRAITEVPRELGDTRWFIGLGLVSLVGYGILGAAGSWRDSPALFGGIGLALGALYGVAVWRARGWATRKPLLKSHSRLFLWVVAVALTSRVMSLGLDASDDVNRYIVEGVQVRLGENPYLVAPELSEVAKDLPAAITDGVNHPDWTAIYPPFTLGFEAVVTAIAPTPMGFKVALLLAELLGLWLVALLLVKSKLSLALWLVVAWNPVGPLFAAGEGHHDALMGTLMVAALSFGMAGRSVIGLVFASFAALTKPFAVVTIAAMARLRSPRTWLLPATIALLCYLPFIDAGGAFFESLGRFGTEKHFHGPLEPLVRWLVGGVIPASAAQAVTAATLGVLWVVASVVIWQRGTLARTPPATLTAHLFAALLLCLPTLHPWYLLPLVMLLPFARSWALVVWTAMAPLYWLHGLAMRDGVWTESLWVTVISHAPALALLAWEVGLVPGRVVSPRAEAGLE